LLFWFFLSCILVVIIIVRQEFGVLFVKRLKKQLALWLYQGWVLRSAAMYMVTSKPECHNVRRLGLNQPVAIVPNGVDVPAHLEARRSADVRTLLFLSRLHPGKGLLDLVEAWAAVRQPGWRIVIAGGGEGGHQAEVERLIHQKGLASDFTWAGFVNGEAKRACFAQADVFVLPTHSENFGIAIAEALAHGLPVITTTGAPWPGLLTHRCGWWVEPGVPGIASALTQALACSPEELNAMGQRGRQWVAERFAWANIGADAALAGAWLLDRSQSMPEFVVDGLSYNDHHEFPIN
jgi:glycosyltransferase involved in cell wall biosynthesis